VDGDPADAAAPSDASVVDTGSSPSDGGNADAATITDAGTPIDASPFGPDIDAGDWSVAGNCNSLVSTAAWVETKWVAADYPAFTGGAIDPGTYVLRKSIDFTGAGGDAGGTGELTTATITVSPPDGGSYSMEFAGADFLDDGGTRTTRTSVTLTPNGTQLQYNQTCTARFALSRDYDATGSGPGATLQFGRGGEFVDTFQKK
ncbi:MAG TPA: hypothetical protein VF407_13555, partial [Polyangiaceae bacterium]